MEEKKIKLNLKIIIPVVIVIVVAIVGITIAMNQNSKNINNYKDNVNKNTKIIGSWKIEAEDNDIFEENIVDSFISEWYDNNYSENDNLNDIVVFKKPDNNYCWLGNVDIHISENYNSDGSIYYLRSNSENAELKNVYVCGNITYLGEEYNKYSSNFTYIVNTYEEALKTTLKLTECSSENEMICISDEQMTNNLKEKLKDNANIVNKMEALLKNGQIEEAKNLYYKNTNLTKGQSKECLILYAKYDVFQFQKNMITEAHLANSNFRIDSASFRCYKDNTSNNDNDYIVATTISHSSRNLLGKLESKTEKNYIHITLDSNTKTYKITKIV